MAEFGEIVSFASLVGGENSMSASDLKDSNSKKRSNDDCDEVEPSNFKRFAAVGADVEQQEQQQQPEWLEPDEDEIMLRNLTDRSNNKLDIFKNIDLDKLYAIHQPCAHLVKKRMEVILSAVDEIRGRQRFDFTLEEHRAVKFLFAYILRSDGTYNENREFDQLHHFCLISTPKDAEIIEQVSKHLVLQTTAGRQSFMGNFVVLLERVDAKNAQRVSFTAYRIVSPFLRQLAADKLGLTNSRLLFFREVLPKATKTHAILRGHDKYVVGHVSMGEVTRGILPNRQAAGGSAVEENNIDPAIAFASAVTAAADNGGSQRYAVYVRAFINSIVSYSDD